MAVSARHYTLPCPLHPAACAAHRALQHPRATGESTVCVRSALRIARAVAHSAADLCPMHRIATPPAICTWQEQNLRQYRAFQREGVGRGEKRYPASLDTPLSC